MPNQTKTLLVVDDEVGIREAVHFLLEDIGYRVLLAQNGKEAIQKLEVHKIDLVITDIYMPECDGIELMNYIRKNHPQIKAIAISGGDQQFLKVSECLGASRIIQKPYGRETLRNAIEELLA